jgi:hypothetical protein
LHGGIPDEALRHYQPLAGVAILLAAIIRESGLPSLRDRWLASVPLADRAEHCLLRELKLTSLRDAKTSAQDFGF